MSDIIEKPKTLFDHLNEVYFGQRKNYFSLLSDADKKTWSNYMVNRFLSMEESYIEIINYFQKYSSILKSENYYKLLISAIPKRKLYNKYIKGVSDEKYESWLLDIFSRYYEISSNESCEYIDLCKKSKEGVDHIKLVCKKFGKTEKEIKKLKL